MTRARRAQADTEMLPVVALLLGWGIGRLRGGRVAHLAGLRLRALWLVAFALLIQLLVFPLFSSSPLVPYATVPFHMLSLALLGAWLLLNLRMRPLIAVAVGATANLFVLALNGGRMPASPTALAGAGWASTAERLMAEGYYGNVVCMGETTRFDVLGDWLYLPEWMPLATAFSVGDVLICAGVAWLIARGMQTND